MFPAIEWIPSPNFRKCSKPRAVTCLVIHATATKGITSPLEWLTSQESKVSAHYLVGPDGTIVKMVQENDVAWHCGQSIWKGQPAVNAFSIGIEVVNPNDGVTPYPDPQIESCRALSLDICMRNKIKLEDVVRHMDIAPGRKTDPAGFPWDNFKADLYKDGMA